MSPRRRQLLRAIGVTGVGGIAGCAALGSPESDGTVDGGDGTDGAERGDGESPVGGNDAVSGDDRSATTAGESRPRGTGEATAIRPVSGPVAERFGATVALSDDGQTALVGARGAKNSDHDIVGTGAYVFTRTNGTWEQHARLGQEAEDQGIAGRIAALSGDGTTAFLTGYEQGDATNSVFVHERDGETWRESGKLVPQGVNEPIRFGRSVAATEDGSTVVVGAPYDPAPHGTESGSGFVFERSDGEWIQRAKLTAADGSSKDRLGHAVDIADDGSVAALGAWYDSDPAGAVSGSVSVFTAADEWSQAARLTADDPQSQERFGWSVALTADGGALLVGAKGRKTGGSERQGAVYRFERADGAWRRRRVHKADYGNHLTHVGTGTGVSDDGSVALIGGYHETPDDNMGPYPRGALVVHRTGGGWEPRTAVAVDNGVEGGAQERPFAISGDGSTVLVGSSERTTEDRDGSGVVYAFDI